MNSPPVPSVRNQPQEQTGTARSPQSTSSSNDNSKGMSTGLVVFRAIAGLLIVLILIVLFICYYKKKERRTHSYPPLPPPPGPKALCYSHPVYNRLCCVGVLSSGYHVSTVPPRPSRPPTGASRPPLLPVQAPAFERPPPPYNNRSGGSGSRYSGKNPLPPPSPGTALGFTLRKFTYEKLSIATDSFSESNLLGQGGFGYVHRGVLQDGKEVAVKQLKAGSEQGEREFQTEVEIISRVHHKHLVSLVGYCKTETQRMIVYEFVPNKTLEFHLHGKGSTRTLDWSERLKISQGTAKGLAYLHEECPQIIIHRDIKATNILLDEHFEAKVADFGLAKITSSADNTHASRVMGTFGYMAPEYVSSGILTVKSDVFSYGVVLLELITGHRPDDSNQSFMGNSFVDWARPLLTQALEDKKFDALVDPRLPKDYDPNEMARMVACAAACVHHSEWCRPRMSQVVMALEGNVSLSHLNEGMRPGPSSVYSSNGSSDNDIVQYNEDMKKIRKLVFPSQECGSMGQYSKSNSEYGLNPSGSSSEGQQLREIEMKRMKNGSPSFGGGKLDGEQLK